MFRIPFEWYSGVVWKHLWKFVASIGTICRQSRSKFFFLIDAISFTGLYQNLVPFNPENLVLYSI